MAETLLNDVSTPMNDASSIATFDDDTLAQLLLHEIGDTRRMEIRDTRRERRHQPPASPTLPDIAKEIAIAMKINFVTGTFETAHKKPKHTVPDRGRPGRMKIKSGAPPKRGPLAIVDVDKAKCEQICSEYAVL